LLKSVAPEAFQILFLTWQTGSVAFHQLILGTAPLTSPIRSGWKNTDLQPESWPSWTCWPQPLSRLHPSMCRSWRVT